MGNNAVAQPKFVDINATAGTSFNCFRCHDHPTEDVKGFCKDCSSGICFRCAIGKHRNHNIVNIDELDKSDLENQIGVFENKIDCLKEKAKALLDRAKNSETHIE